MKSPMQQRLMISTIAICFATVLPTGLSAAEDTHHGHQGQGSGHETQQGTSNADQHGAGNGGQQGDHRHGGGHGGQQAAGPSVQPGVMNPTYTTGVQHGSHDRSTTTQTQGAGTMFGATGGGQWTDHTSRHRKAHGSTTNFNIGISPRGGVSVDISAYRRNVTSDRHYHYGEYRAPQDYAYRRWSYGDRLPSEYYVRDYWLANFLNFGLMEPPDGYVWVRYGSDALLVDEHSGEVVQVVYNVFY